MPQPSSSAVASPEVLPLNRSEYSYAALAGVACNINQVYTLRFDTQVSLEQVRAAARRLVSAQPRLRGVVEPVWLGWRFRILPDDEVMDQLFHVAFRVVRGVDVDSIEALENYAFELLNEPVTLERGLGLRFAYLPHPQRPAFLVSVDHTLGDGRSMMMWVHMILKLINGQEIPTETKVDSPSMVAAIAPLRWRDWPRCWLASRRHRQQAKRVMAGRNLCVLDTKVLPRMTAHAVRYHVMPIGSDVLKAAAKKLGASVNTLLLTALSQTLLNKRAGDPNALASIRLSLDLRPYFPKDRTPGMGNYVATFFVHETPRTVAEHIQSIDAQMREGQSRFERREMIFPWLIPAEFYPALGRRLYALMALKMRRSDKFLPMSCHFTTVGDMSWINPKGAQIRMAEFYPTSPSSGPFFGTSSFAGKQLVILGYQHDRTTREAMDLFMQEFNASVTSLVQASGVQEAAVTA